MKLYCVLASLLVSCSSAVVQPDVKPDVPQKDTTTTPQTDTTITPEPDTTVTPQPEVRSIRILAIGNSFSEDAVEQNLYELFKEDGTEAVIGNMYIGGCDLQKHWNNANSNNAAYSYRKIVAGKKKTNSSITLQQALADEPWDYISFQQGAGLYREYDSCFPYLPDLIAYARKYSKNKSFKVIYHATWAAAQNSTKNYFFDYFKGSQGYMYTSSNEMTAKLDSTLKFDLICNTIDAIQSARTSYLGDTFNRDGWHLSYTHGRYTAACLWYERISGNNVVGYAYHPAEITSAEDVKVCQTAAHLASLYPYKIVDMSDMSKIDPLNPVFVAPPADPEPQVPDVDPSILAKWVLDKNRAVSDGYKQTWTSSDTELGKYIYSNAPGEVGHIMANGGGNGKLSFVQVDKTQWTGEKQQAGRYLLNGSPGGQPAVCGIMKGDYWLFETLGGNNFPAGERLVCEFWLHPGQYGPKYWRVEYLDGTEWVPASALKKTSISTGSTPATEEIEFNFEMVTNAKTSCKVDVTLKNPTPEFRVRAVCCSSWQVNAKWFAAPNTPSVLRVAGTEATGDLPVMRKEQK